MPANIASAGNAPMVDVRFGSKADMCGAKCHVRFTPESGHVQCNSACPLSANSGHCQLSVSVSPTQLKRSRLFDSCTIHCREFVVAGG